MEDLGTTGGPSKAKTKAMLPRVDRACVQKPQPAEKRARCESSSETAEDYSERTHRSFKEVRVAKPTTHVATEQLNIRTKGGSGYASSANASDARSGEIYVLRANARRVEIVPFDMFDKTILQERTEAFKKLQTKLENSECQCPVLLQQTTRFTELLAWFGDDEIMNINAASLPCSASLNEKKRGGNRRNINSVKDREIQAIIAHLGRSQGGLFNPHNKVTSQAVLLAVGRKLTNSTDPHVTTAQARQCLDVVAHLMSYDGLNILRDILIRGVVDTNVMSQYSKSEHRFDIPPVPELHEFMKVSLHVACLEEQSDTAWWREIYAWATLADGYDALVAKLDNDLEAGNAVSRVSIQLRQSLAPGKRAQRHSTANDAITLTIFRNCHPGIGHKGAEVFKYRREDLLNRIRQGRNLVLIRNYINIGAWAMLAKYKWKTLLSNTNPKNLEVALSASTVANPMFAQAYQHIRNAFVRPLTEGRDITNDFRLVQLRQDPLHDVQLTGTELLGRVVGMVEDVMMGGNHEWNHAADNSKATPDVESELFEPLRTAGAINSVEMHGSSESGSEADGDEEHHDWSSDDSESVKWAHMAVMHEDGNEAPSEMEH